MLSIRSLEQTPLFQIVNCFNGAFADYFIPFHVTVNYMRDRWRGSRVDYKLSYGVFSGKQLVGFVITGIDTWQNKLTAYNAGTGILPAHRGQGLLERIYKQLIPELKERRIHRGVLEVICENEKAIRAYQKVGFEKVRQFRCFSGTVRGTISPQNQMEVKRYQIPQWSQYSDFPTFPACWDNNRNTITLQADEFEAIHLLEGEKLLAYAIWKPEQRYIAQFSQRQLRDGLMLFHMLKQKSASLKINNVDVCDHDSLELLQQVGLQKVIDQWEMQTSW